MTEQVKRFLDDYFVTLNGYKSAVNAGFSEKTATVQACQMLGIEENQVYLQNLRESLSEKTGISQQKVLEEIAKIAFSDIRNYYQDDNNLKPICDLEDNEAAALASVKSYEEKLQGSEIIIGVNKEIKLYDKLAGLEKLARHLGLYQKDNEQSKPVNNINLTKESIQDLSKKLDGDY